MVCRVLPPRSVHPLAIILLPHNGLLVGGEKNYHEGRVGREGARDRQKDEERRKKMKKAISSRAAELSYSCYDLSSLNSLSLSSFSFLVPTPFCSPLGPLGRFYLSNEPLILFSSFSSFVITSFVLDGRQYLSFCQASFCMVLCGVWRS